MRQIMHLARDEWWPRATRLGRNPRARWVITALLIVIVVAGLGAMLYGNRDVILTYDWQIRPRPLLASFIVYSIALGLAVLVWGRIINRLAGRRSWLGHIRIYCTTILAQRLPGVLWHVAGRMMLYGQDGVGKTVISVSSGLELALIVISGLIVSLLTWPLLASTNLENPWWLLIGLVGGLVVVHPRIVNLILRRLGADGFSERQLSYWDILNWLAIYVLIWLLGGIILYSIINVIYPLPANLLPGVIGAWSLSGVVATVSTFSPFGFGIREISLTLLLSPFLPTGIAAVVAILARLLLTLYEVCWALITNKLVS